nr:hypothetical protein Iba_chr05aCG5890 [Ipomoea batatas]
MTAAGRERYQQAAAGRESVTCDAAAGRDTAARGQKAAERCCRRCCAAGRCCRRERMLPQQEIPNILRTMENCVVYLFSVDLLAHLQEKTRIPLETSSMHIILPFTIFFGGIIHPFTAAEIRGSGGGFDPDIAHPLQLSSEDISL